MTRYIAIFVCFFSVVLSVIEGSNYLDTHHDPIIFSNSIFIMNGLLPYKDFYVQYGIIQPAINAIFFKIFGARFLIQNLVVAIAYGIFLFYNFRLINKLINEKVALLFLLTIFLLEPYVILPWPNFFMGLFSVISLFHFIKFIQEKKVNDIYISLFFICLLPLTRMNAGIIVLPIILIASLYITYKYICLRNVSKFLTALIPLFLLIYLFQQEDFIKQAFILPSEYILPHYFQIPNDLLFIAVLHFNLFFLEPNLFSVVSATENLFIWRYILIIGIISSGIFILYNLLTKKIFSELNIIIFILGAYAVSMSSSVFPIFDTFRAMNAWYPLMIAIFLLSYKYLSLGKFYTFFLPLPLLLLFINLNHYPVSINTVFSLYNSENFKVQLIDFSEPFDVIPRDNYDITQDDKDKPTALPLNKYQRLPLDQYLKVSDVMKNRCSNKKFISTSSDFLIYLLDHKMYKNIAHKMYYYQIFTNRKGVAIDANIELYPDFKNNLNSFEGLCLLYHHRIPKMILDDLREFDEEIILGDHSIFIR